MDILPIETHRLLLRQFAVEDAEDVFVLLHIPFPVNLWN